MERVLDVYKRAFDRLRPEVCMDESPKQLITETRVTIPGLPGRVARLDYEYRRCGVCTVFLASEPLAGLAHGQDHGKKNKAGLGPFP